MAAYKNQRENRRVKYSPGRGSAYELTRENHEGYSDPTAYQALLNLEREAARKKKIR